MNAVAYLAYYHLQRPPFGREYDESFLSLGKQAEQVYAAVESDLTRKAGTLIISGQDGVGKTTLLHHLKKQFEDTHVVTYFGNLPGNLLQAFSQIASELSIHRRFSNKSEFLVLLRNRLQNLSTNQRQWLLLVDDAHLIKGPIVKELYMLSKIRMHGRPVVQMVFAGEAHIVDSLMKFGELETSDSTPVHHELMPLSKADTIQYISHRLKAAGRSKKLFKEDAIKKIFINSGGIPLSINLICDQALKEGFKSKKKLIKADIVNRCDLHAARRSREERDQPDTQKAAKNLDTSDTAGRKSDFYSALYITLVVVAVIFFCGFAAYYYYEFLRSETDTWKIEEIAPKENPLINERLRQKNIEEEKLGAAPTATQNMSPPAAEDAQAVPETGEEVVTSKALAEKPSDKNAGMATDWQSVEKLLVYFKHDSNELSDEAYQSLNDLAEFLKASPGLDIVVRGYTDSTGTYNYNIAISKIRAKVVESYLMARGVAPDRIESFGLGSNDPIRSNTTAEGRRLNRRVEIEIVAR